MLAIVSSIALALKYMHSFGPCFSRDIWPRVGLLDHMAVLFLVF